MTCQILQLQTFAPAKVIYVKPVQTKVYTKEELIKTVIEAVRIYIYPEMTFANKLLFDKEKSIFSANRNRALVAARFFIMYFMYMDFRWTDERCASYFGMHRTASFWARQKIHDQISWKFNNQYKDVYNYVNSRLLN